MRTLIMLMSCATVVACGGGAPADELDADLPADAGMRDGGSADAGPLDDAGADGGCPTACDAPPAAECADATTLREWARMGTCTDGSCTYRSRETPCELPAPTCEGGVATTWESPRCADGACTATPVETACAAGCCDDGCCELTPSNADVLGPLGASDLTVEPPSDFTFDTDDCDGTTPLGECSAVEVFDAPDVCVCRSRRLRVGDTLKVVGSRALALFAAETIVIRGLLDVSADGTTSGPGSARAYSEAATGKNGGAGGSFGTQGAGASAPTYGNEALVPLLGGMDGQDSCGGRLGGGGGGALQLSAGVNIEITGVIDASGGGGQGGQSGTSCNGGPGGGSGGGVLIEAPEVEITGTVVANGGGAGAAGNDEWYGGGGEDGGPSGGGPGGNATDCGCALFGYTDGGDGGWGASESAGPTRGEPPDSESSCIGTCVVGGGGHGGGLGRVRVNSATGCLCGGTFSPAASFGTATVD